MWIDYLGIRPDRDHAASVDVTFSIPEAAELLRIPMHLLRTLLQVPGLCSCYETTGRISEGAVRCLYEKLNSSA